MRARLTHGLLLTIAAAALPAPAARAAALPSPLAKPAAFADPPAQVRPKFRWWWDAPFDAGEFRSELEAMADAGFGGAEAAFNPGSWASADQRQMLELSLQTARRRGLRLDMTLGASWPVKTPNTQAASGLAEQELYYGRADLIGGVPFAGAAPPPVDLKPGRLVAVTAAKVIREGPPVLAPIPAPNLLRPLAAPIRSTILDPASLTVLDASGTVRFTPPDRGHWIVFAFWQRASSEGVMDHLNRDATRAVAGFLDANQIGDAAGALLPSAGGHFFEDSLELDVQELMWTGRLAAEFRKRRGYDVTKYLPVLFVQGMQRYPVPQEAPPADFDLPGGLGERARHDYYDTVMDLYADEHIGEFAGWARTHGMTYRTQAGFGNAFDATRSAREVATAGGLADDESLNAGDPATSLRDTNWRFAMDHYRAVVGGAQQGGAREISTELGAMFFRDQEAGLDLYKALMDKAWAAGITRPIVHGFAYQPPGAGWPGRNQFTSIVAQSWNHRAFPQWPLWKPLADYWARGTLVLQQGRPRIDVAVYRDRFTTSAATFMALATNVLNHQLDPALGGGIFTDGEGGQRIDDALGFKPRAMFDARALERAGYSLQYLDPQGLTDRRAAGRGALYPKGPDYRALVLDERALPCTAARAIARGAERGLAVVVIGTPPARGTGLADAAAAEDRCVKDAVARMLASPRVRRIAAQRDVRDALRALRVVPAVDWDGEHPVYTQLRRDKAGDYAYLWNAGAQTLRLRPSFAASGTPLRLDLWSGRIERLAVYTAGRGRVSVPLTLAPGETAVLAFRRTPQPRRAHVRSSDADETVIRGRRAELRAFSGGPRTAHLSTGRRRRVVLPDVPAPLVPQRWALRVVQAAPGAGTLDVALTALRDWRQIRGLERAAGTGTYTTTLQVPSDWVGPARGAVLELGRVGGAMQVFLNDRLVAADVTPTRRLDVSALLRPGDNTLRIVVATTLKNALVGQPTQPLYLVQPATQPYGLLGPVRLVPYASARIGLPLLRASPAFSRRSRRSASSSGVGSHAVTSGRSFSAASPKSLRNSGVVR